MQRSAGRYDVPVDPDDLNTSYGLIFGQVPDGCTVLDLGCGSGALGAVLVERRGCTVTGIDHDEAAVAAARRRGLEAHVADLTSVDLDALLDRRRFDRIIVADVLEHLVEPERLLSRLTSLLAPGGAIVASIPNISHVDVLLMLSGDRWDYVPAGLLDRTHLRFYTLAGIRSLADACGLRIVSAGSSRLPALATEIWRNRRPEGMTPRMLLAWTVMAGQRNPHDTVYQHVVVLEPGDSGAPGRRTETAEAELSVVISSAPGRVARLRDALYSVAALTHPSVAAIVVVPDDDAWRREVCGLAARLRGLVDVRIVAVDDPAPRRARALNAGLDAAGGDFVCFLDDGDLLYPQFAAVLVEALRARPDLTAAYGASVRCSGRDTADGFIPERKAAAEAVPFDRFRQLFEDRVPGGSVLYRRADLRAAGIRFDETLDVLEDWALLRGLCRWHEVAAVATPVGEHRDHPSTPESEVMRERTRARICDRTVGAPVAVTEQELRALVDAAQERGALQERVAALAGEVAETRTRLEGLRTPGLRTSLRRWGLHRPLRAVYRLGMLRRSGR